MTMNLLDRLALGHERLKHRIHNYRIPLSARGQRVMGFVYFCIPLLAGYGIMNWTMKKAEMNTKDLKQSSSNPGVAERNDKLERFLRRQGVGASGEAGKANTGGRDRERKGSPE